MFKHIPRPPLPQDGDQPLANVSIVAWGATLSVLAFVAFVAHMLGFVAK